MSGGAVIAAGHPFVVEVEPGTYGWCRCGRSAIQPFCDGSPKVTLFTPVEVEITERQKVAFYGCKHTGTQPRCEGTHKTLP